MSLVLMQTRTRPFQGAHLETVGKRPGQTYETGRGVGHSLKWRRGVTVEAFVKGLKPYSQSMVTRTL